MPVVNPTPLAPVPATPGGGPCNWSVNTACVPGWDELDPAVQSAATSWATYILWALTGRQFGPCSVTVRPCGPRCGGPAGYLTYPVGPGGSSGAGMPWMIPWIDNGIWRNCGCTGGCTCSATCEVALPGPVAAVDEVKVGGLVLDPSAYRVDGYRGIPILVRTDGDCWPQCQDMDAADTEPDTFTITYQRGTAVPVAGEIAAGELAGEFAKACTGGDCMLPQQLASLSRNGVEVQVVDPGQLLENGLTGIANVDLWIRAVNPARKAQRSRVYSTDAAGARYVT